MPKHKNHISFNDYALRRIRPPVDRQERYWDKGQRGLSVLVSPGGTKTFFVMFKLHGKWITHKLGRFGEMVPGADDTHENAQVGEVQRLAREYRTLANKGIDPRKALAIKEAPVPDLSYGAVVDQ